MIARAVSNIWRLKTRKITAEFILGTGYVTRDLRYFEFPNCTARNVLLTRIIIRQSEYIINIKFDLFS